MFLRNVWMFWTEPAGDIATGGPVTAKPKSGRSKGRTSGKKNKWRKNGGGWDWGERQCADLEGLVAVMDKGRKRHPENCGVDAGTAIKYG